MPTWDASQYRRFERERTLPVHDLINGLFPRVGAIEPKRVIDLGCGPGNSTAVLRERFPHADLVGLDSSAEMLTAAHASGTAAAWRTQSIEAFAHDLHEEPFDLIFSNAVFQWVPDQATILPALLEKLSPGGVLAFQVPFNLDSPAQTAIQQLADVPRWATRFTHPPARWHVLELGTYYDLFATRARSIDLWTSEYVHILGNAADLIEWYRGTGLRPYLEALTTDEHREQFLHELQQLFDVRYPPQADGRVLFPFRRLFAIVHA